jgi:S1-C subfamily serine protease
MKVDDVNPGGPAEKGGMQKGDVIIRFGGKSIRNIYDYTYALGEFKPGDRVEVIVKRGAEEVTLYLDLTKRSP